MQINEVAVKGIVVLGVFGVVAGGILAALKVDNSVANTCLVIGSNALSALAGALIAVQGDNPVIINKGGKNEKDTVANSVG